MSKPHCRLTPSFRLARAPRVGTCRKVLVAACERRCVLLFDTLTRRNVHTVEEAHQGYVNCVK